MFEWRLAALEALDVPAGPRVYVARGRLARLAGLALMRRAPAGSALLIPRCRSVHTFGMRFPIDVLFLAADGRPLRLVRRLRPWRVIACRGAAAVIERPASADGMMSLVAPEQRNRFAAALDPRQPIYRDSYNEYFVLVLSAGGAAAGTQVPLYIVMAITGLWPMVPFVLACVAFELAVIFGLARPQMQPQERIGWAVLWGAVTALFAVCFYYLVAEPTL